ncbi:MAG: DUF3106 domain-containing protein [Comamonas sp.]
MGGFWAVSHSSNIYGSAPTDWVSAPTTIRGGTPRAGEGPGWDSLDADEQKVLEPLEAHWDLISEPQKRRWILIADSFDDFSADEQARIGEHMKEWAKLGLREQSQARLNYSNINSLSPERKRELWEEYQALSARERKRLAQVGLHTPGVALALRSSSKASSRLAKIPAAAINPNRANPPKILPPPEIKIQSRPPVTTVEIGAPAPLPPSGSSPASPPPPPPPPPVETSPVQTPGSVTPTPLPPASHQGASAELSYGEGS